MNYFSICSGIEAASVAWHSLGWTPVGFSEIEPFPCAVLAHRFPHVKNYGDMTKFADWNIDESVDLLVGGTPCQSFSVAGLRQGLKDPRGNLMLTFLGIAERFRPRWIVWENVPGVLSSNGGRDFGAFLGALEKLGYGWAYRVLDAQWVRTHRHPRAVPQRRRRVFVVGCLVPELAQKVLFESESVRRDPSSRKQTKQDATREIAGCVRSGGDGGVPSSRGEHLVYDRQRIGQYGDNGVASTCSARDYKDATDLVVGALCASDYKGIRNQSIDEGKAIVIQGNLIGRGDTAGPQGVGASTDGASYTLTKADVHGVLYENHPNDSRVTGPHDVAPSCVSRYGTGGGNVPLVQQAVPYDLFQVTAPLNKQNRTPESPCHTLARDNAAHAAVAVDVYNQTVDGDVAATVTAAAGGTSTSGPKALESFVRRLTPLECERLQGFPDGWTDVPYRGKPAPDGGRYKALGNSMAVNCMEWIGDRINSSLEKFFEDTRETK